jgi:predicted secreted protein
VAEVTVRDDQNGARITARVGDTIVVRLPEISGAGYRWTLTSVDSEALEMEEHRYEPARAGVGGAGASVWRFTPKRAGRTRVELKKVRPWNPGDPAGERFAVDLEIGDS